MIRSFRYWLSDILYWLAEKIEPYNFELHINNKPANADNLQQLKDYIIASTPITEEEKNKIKDLLKVNK